MNITSHPMPRHVALTAAGEHTPPQATHGPGKREERRVVHGDAVIIGNGNTIVVFFSTPISISVWRAQRDRGGLAVQDGRHFRQFGLAGRVHA